MKIGYLACGCGRALIATRNRVYCTRCNYIVPRAAAALHIAMIAIERDLRIDCTGIQVDERGRLVFLYQETVEP